MRRWIPVLLVLVGCTAGRAGVAIVQANQAVDRARDRGAVEHATYEVTMAEAYLVKAREEASFSSYKDSVELARQAADWADKAIIAMEREGRGGAVSAAVEGAPRPPSPTSPEPASGESTPSQADPAVPPAEVAPATEAPAPPAGGSTEAPEATEPDPAEPPRKVIIVPRAPTPTPEGDE